MLHGVVPLLGAEVVFVFVVGVVGIVVGIVVVIIVVVVVVVVHVVVVALDVVVVAVGGFCFQKKTRGIELKRFCQSVVAPR